MPVVKGGVWTNIEDEILKASIAKYGLNQWARVSSLLARKTPKQCKARWNEWLDPSIKKIEWNKEEDEKLLHLAKLMPTQWRTIAPLVGRTANQCLERYQKLLDEAEQREASELGLAGPDGGETKAPTADDVRRLRPGELDPDPETKPAKPDTIDLDEDEKEMLSEARARLANTQGKKAKRKARERQQEESRRMAALQKRRELKTAGINIKVVTRKKGQMDYNADIPFERKPAAGFYDTTEEQTYNEKERVRFDPKTLQLGGKRNGEGDEDPDRKKRKNDKDTPSASVQAALKAGKMQKIREAEQSSKRRKLNLPAPQVSEGELEEIVKMGMMGERASVMAKESENDSTQGLVSSYTNVPTRTPRTPSISQTPLRTPRDQFALNAADSRPAPAFGSLPKPKQTEFNLATPEDKSEITSPEELEEDAAEVQRRENALRAAQEELEWKRQTQVIQRNLPRPPYLNVDDMFRFAEGIADRAKALISRETAILMANDAQKFPEPGSELVGKVPPLRPADDSRLTDAKLLILLETKHKPSRDEVAAVWNKRTEASRAVRLGLTCYMTDGKQETEMLREAFKETQELIMEHAESDKKREGKLGLHMGGYVKRNKILKSKMEEATKALDDARSALSSFRTLQIGEQAAIASRLEVLRDDVGYLNRREREAQENYKKMKDEVDSLL